MFSLHVKNDLMWNSSSEGAEITPVAIIFHVWRFLVSGHDQFGFCSKVTQFTLFHFRSKWFIILLALLNVLFQREDALLCEVGHHAHPALGLFLLSLAFLHF